MTSVAISPFCELARWVLERLGIEYHESCHAPIFNVPFTKLAGGGVNVPVVQTPDAVLETEALLGYLDRHAPQREGLYPTDPALRRETQDLVHWLITDVAIAVRLYAYAHMLPRRDVTSRLMTARAPFWERAIVRMIYPIQAWAMRRALGISDESVAEARRHILSAFDKLSQRLASSSYLVGPTLTVADLTFAAVTAPVTLPPEYGAPLPAFAELPAPMQETVCALRVTAAGRY